MCEYECMGIYISVCVCVCVFVYFGKYIDIVIL